MAEKILYLAMVLSIAWIAMAKETNEEGCYIRQAKKFVPIGTVVTPVGECVTIKCEGNGAVSMLTCPSEMNLNPNCHFTEIDVSVSYPDCCPHLQCWQSSSSETQNISKNLWAVVIANIWACYYSLF